LAKEAFQKLSEAQQQVLNNGHSGYAQCWNLSQFKTYAFWFQRKQNLYQQVNLSSFEEDNWTGSLSQEKDTNRLQWLMILRRNKFAILTQR
jgi:hypothetical protein